MSCYKASGKVYLRKKTLANQPFQFIGNATATLTTAVNESSVPDFTSVAGGNACVDKLISKVGLDLLMYDFKKENLARAVQGALSVGSVVAIVEEPVNAFLDEFIPVANLIDLATPPVVKDATGVTTYVVNTDYTVEQGGIRVVAGGAIAIAIAAGSGTPKFVIIHVSYTPLARSVVEALCRAGDQYEVIILTQNRANAAKYGKWTIHTVDFGPTSSLAIIAAEFGNFTLSGESLPDSSKGDGTNTSTYFKIQTEA